MSLGNDLDRARQSFRKNKQTSSTRAYLANEMYIKEGKKWQIEPTYPAVVRATPFNSGDRVPSDITLYVDSSTSFPGSYSHCYAVY